MQRTKKQLGTLRIISPTEKPRRYLLTKEEIKIGRNPGNDLMIDHQTISRNHARLFYADGKWWIEDLVSRNGTYINHNVIPHQTPVEIQSGISLRLGDVNLVYRRTLPPAILWAGLGLTACIALLVLLLAILAIINTLRARESTVLSAFAQPALSQAVLFETALPGISPGLTPDAATPPSRPTVSPVLMELDFPYDGGNERIGGVPASFVRQTAVQHGRQNQSFS